MTPGQLLWGLNIPPGRKYLPAVETYFYALERQRFTGKRWDAATGLYYSGARYYDAEIGRFISWDPAFDWLNGTSIQFPVTKQQREIIDAFGIKEPV